MTPTPENRAESHPSFYRRPLPSPLVAFSSPEGRALFAEAMAGGDLEGYFALAEQFHTQSDPAFCGLGTLVVALNALGVDPGRLWKGPWRWYSEEMLDCCAPLDQVKQAGVTLDQFACLARCNGARVEVTRAGDGGPGGLREAIERASRTPGVVLAAAYDRKALGQTGGGHFSPVAGYHRGRDLALILDVARFKYPPHWAPVEALWGAMQPPDPQTGKPRGYALLTQGEVPALLFYRLSLSRCSWPELSRQLFDELPAALAAARPAGAREAVAAILGALPASACSAAGTVDELIEGGLDDEHRRQAEGLRGVLKGTALFAEVAAALQGPGCCEAADRAGRAELATVLLLAAAPSLLPSLSGPARDEFEALTRADLLPGLAPEIGRLRAQIALLRG